MPSPARLAANRANALRSTGPKTPAGKATSALNAVTTGLYSRQVVLATLGESTETLDTFRAAVAADLDADGPVELELADQVAAPFGAAAGVAKLILARAEFRGRDTADPMHIARFKAGQLDSALHRFTATVKLLTQVQAARATRPVPAAPAAAAGPRLYVPVERRQKVG